MPSMIDTFTQISLPSDVQTQTHLSSLGVDLHSFQGRGTEHALTSKRKAGLQH